MPLSETTTAYGPYGTVNIEYLLLQIYKVVTGTGVETESALSFLETFWFWFQLVSYSISVLLIVGIIYSLIRCMFLI